MAMTLQQKKIEAFIKRAGFTYGWRNLESWARRMAERAVQELDAAFIDAHLSAQAKVRVTDEDVDFAKQAAYDIGDASAITDRAMRAALETFTARLSQGAQGEDRSSWSFNDRVEFALRDAGFCLDEASRIAMNAERAAVPAEFDGERYCDMVDAYYEAIGNGWNLEQAMGCAIRAYFAASRPHGV